MDGMDEIERIYGEALRREHERGAKIFETWLGTRPPPTRWQRMTSPVRRLVRRVGEVWNVARHGAGFYQDY